MKYTKKDLICDYLSSCKIFEYEQEYREEYTFFNKIDKSISLEERYLKILEIMKVCRIENFNRSYYKKHKSYPSARSFYKQKIWISIGNNNFATINEFTGEIIVYENKFIDSDKGDIIITADNIKFENYKRIHNTLNVLEVGHMIYNISEISKKYGFSIKVNAKVDNFVCIKSEKKNNLIYDSIENKYITRTSGKYIGKLINLNMNVEEAFYEIKTNKEKDFYSLFSYELKSIVKYIVFRNNKCDGFVFGDIKIDYEILNKEYSYIDFRSCSQYTLLIFDKSIIKKKIITDYILFMGYLAQEICILNSKKYIYNRPVKQVYIPIWKEILKNTVYKDDIPFYGVITGIETFNNVKF